MASNLNIVCVIPARGGSKGIPKKNIRELRKKPLIVWSIEQALASKYLGKERVFVTSDDREILSVAERAGANSILRPLEMAGDQAPTEPALQHAILEIERTTTKKVDVVVFLQCTSPLRQSHDIDHAIETLMNENSDSLLSATPIKDYFVWKKASGSAESLNFDYKNRKRRQDLATLFLENGSIYVFRREILLKFGNRLGGKISIYSMPKIYSFQIDEPEDFEICESILERMEVS